MTTDRNAWIQERAYHLWLEAGRPHGADQEYWYRAERELIEVEGGSSAKGTEEAIPVTTTQRAAEAKEPRTQTDFTPARSSRPRAKSPTATQSDPQPRAARSRLAASGSGSLGSRRPATAKQAE